MNRLLCSMIVLNALVFLPTGSSAQTGGPYELTWSSVDAGGGISQGGDYKLAGVVGQPDASSQPATGGVYALTGGFLQDSSYFPVPVQLSALSIE